MTNASRVTMIRLLAFGVLVLAATSWAQQRPPIVEQIAKTYGLDSFGQIEAIRYTWNGDSSPESSKSPTPGSGSPRPARSPTKERIKTVSRSRLPTCAPSSAANPTP